MACVGVSPLLHHLILPRQGRVEVIPGVEELHLLNVEFGPDLWISHTFFLDVVVVGSWDWVKVEWALVGRMLDEHRLRNLSVPVLIGKSRVSLLRCKLELLYQ